MSEQLLPLISLFLSLCHGMPLSTKDCGWKSRWGSLRFSIRWSTTHTKRLCLISGDQQKQRYDYLETSFRPRYRWLLIKDCIGSNLITIGAPATLRGDRIDVKPKCMEEGRLRGIVPHATNAEADGHIFHSLWHMPKSYYRLDRIIYCLLGR